MKECMCHFIQMKMKLLYKEKGIKDKFPTMSDEEQYELLSTDGMLVKRPMVIGHDFVLVGFKENDWKEKLRQVIICVSRSKGGYPSRE